MTGTPESSRSIDFLNTIHLETPMTKISRLLTLGALAATLLTGTAFAQSASSGSMSSMSHGKSQMSSGAMSSGDHMKTNHMKSGHMKANHMKSGKHSKKMSHHTASGAMTSGH
jgi:pentapeptide MXKDX repeat protein